jgi:hypothetical protein
MNVPFLMAGHDAQSPVFAQGFKALCAFTFGVRGRCQMAMMPPVCVSGGIIACHAGIIGRKPARGWGITADHRPINPASAGDWARWPI